MSLLVDVALEAFGSKFLLPVSSEPTLAAMEYFGGHSMVVPACVAVTGGFAAQAASFFIGRLLLKLKEREQIFVSEKVYTSCAAYASGLALPVLLLSWMDFGALLAVAAGFFAAPAPRALPVLALSMAGFYAWQVVY